MILFTHGFYLNLNSGNNNQRNDDDEKNPFNSYNDPYLFH